jgi:hypothetical protein
MPGTGSTEASLPILEFGCMISPVSVTLPLDRMTTAEKLNAMEALWENLTHNADAFESPVWHGDILREREQRVAEGKETYMDWDAAKKELRDRLR